jgi:hypothetical protein
MRLTNIFLISLLFLCSCSAKYHINRAIKKDPSIKEEVLDTVRFTNVVLDTVYTSDSTFYINEIITHYDTVISYQKYNFAGLKNWFETLQEEKTKRVDIRNERKKEKTKVKQEGKTDRTQIRQENKTKRGRSLWWLWVAVGCLIGYIVRTFLYGIKITR